MWAVLTPSGVTPAGHWLQPAGPSASDQRELQVTLQLEIRPKATTGGQTSPHSDAYCRRFHNNITCGRVNVPGQRPRRPNGTHATVRPAVPPLGDMTVPRAALWKLAHEDGTFEPTQRDPEVAGQKRAWTRPGCPRPPAGSVLSRASFLPSFRGANVVMCRFLD